tara:strand:- start:18544 stop:19758 length:1215 start_codon:yes stop_codon:yes gene_type:complete
MLTSLSIYTWKGLDEHQTQCTGYCIAWHPDDVTQQLKAKNINPYLIKPQPLWHKIYIQYSIKPEHIHKFTRHLDMMQGAGLPITTALEQLHTSHFATHLMRCHILKTIQSGASLYDAFSHYPRHFDPFYLNLIQTGQQTGALQESFQWLHLYQKKSKQFKDKTRQAMLYPCIILVVALGLSVLLLTQVLPQMQSMYQQFHAQLPWLTQSLLYISTLLNEHGSKFAASFSLLCLSFNVLRKKKPIKLQLDRLLLCLPGIRQWLHDMISARTLRILAITQACGLPILSSLDALANAHHNTTFQRAMFQLKQDIMGGEHIYQAMQHNGFFKHSPLTIELIKTGEQTGQLTKATMQLAEIYEQKLNERFSTLSQMIEPCLMLCVALCVGVLILGMYLPIFQMTDLIQS